MPGAAVNGNGPDEDQLSPDLGLFLNNMQMADTFRPTEPENKDFEIERLVLELESEGKDFHTVFKNQ